MRPIESALAVANLLAFLALAIPVLPTQGWAGLVAPIALIIAIVQVLVEGPRWQMVPAYGLTLVLFSTWLVGILAPGGVPVNRLIAGVGIGLGALLLVVSIALPIVLPVFHFREPTGPYAIGTTTYHWVDPSRSELFTTDPTDHRELMAQVWYPARHDPSAPRAHYIPDADTVAPELARLFGFPRFFFTHFKNVTTNAVASAPIATDQSSYPVLIFPPGLNGFRQMNTFQVEELASHGYIVVGLDQPGAVASVRFPDGRQVSGLPRDVMYPAILQSVEPQPETPRILGNPLPDGIIPYFAQDVTFALDQLTAINEADPNQILTGRLDLGRAGTFGISLGGMTAAEACLRDPRLKACLIMDVNLPADVVNASLQQPTMLITRDAATMRLERERAGGWTEKDIALTLTTMRAVYESLPGDGYYLLIPRMFHLNFTDVPYWSPVISRVGLTGPIDGQRGLDILSAYSLAFFDTHLQGQPSPLLDGPSEQYPEVSFESRRH